MARELEGKRVAILMTKGFEQEELFRPKQALEDAGATVDIISPIPEKVRGWDHTDWGDEVAVDVPLDQAHVESYDALMLPGGVMNPDKLRMEQKAVDFVRAFFDEGNPVAAICHAPWMLVEAGVLKNRTLTSYWSLQTDVRNAGGEWVDREVVVDGNLVTSRNPDDIPAFNRHMVLLFAAGAGEYRKQFGQRMEEEEGEPHRGEKIPERDEYLV